jgi:hypothetical protein
MCSRAGRCHSLHHHRMPAAKQVILNRLSSPVNRRQLSVANGRPAVRRTTRIGTTLPLPRDPTKVPSPVLCKPSSLRVRSPDHLWLAAALQRSHHRTEPRLFTTKPARCMSRASSRNESTRPIWPEQSTIHKADLGYSIGIDVFLSVGAVTSIRPRLARFDGLGCPAV